MPPNRPAVPPVRCPPSGVNPNLKSHVDALRLDDEWYEVIGGERGEGAIIISKLPRNVDFAAYLADRTANFVPVESIDDILLGIDAYTQTIGVWPESLKAQLENVVPFYGAQRLVTLGNALYNGPLMVWPMMPWSRFGACANGSPTRSPQVSPIPPHSAEGGSSRILPKPPGARQLVAAQRNASCGDPRSRSSAGRPPARGARASLHSVRRAFASRHSWLIPTNAVRAGHSRHAG